MTLSTRRHSSGHACALAGNLTALAWLLGLISAVLLATGLDNQFSVWPLVQLRILLDRRPCFDRYWSLPEHGSALPELGEL